MFGGVPPTSQPAVASKNCDLRGPSTASVFCTYVEHVRDEGTDTFPIDVNSLTWHAALNTCDLQAALAKYRNVQIRGFTEWRQKLTDKQIWTPSVFYHPFLVLEAQGGLCISIERYHGRLELSFGTGTLVPFFFEQYHAGGCHRATACYKHEHVALHTSQTTVGELVSWLSGPLAKARQGYDLLRSNCQHFAQDLARFLHDPKEMQAAAGKDRDLVLRAVQEFGSTLELAAPDLRNDREIVLAAVCEDGSALRHADARLRADRQVVLAAVRRNGLALQFADESAMDLEVLLAAVEQNGVSLWLAPTSFRANRCLALAAVQRTGTALQFAAEHLRADREIVEAAVSQCGMAVRFVTGELRHDVEVARIAVHQNPAAAKFISEDLRSELLEPVFAPSWLEFAVESVLEPVFAPSSLEFAVESVLKQSWI